MQLVDPKLPHRTRIFAYTAFALVLAGSLAVWLLSVRESLRTFGQSLEGGAATQDQLKDGFQNAFAK
ncbi:hypothetical protein HYW18_02165 [Candidatus Uhrbacteria bacterium]|nr:hypothetical protein [Candidatus Uhrbacteria bacterium]